MTPVAELRDVDFAYPAPAARRGRPFQLASITFAIERGEVLGVIGPNSAGKTTVIRLLSRVVAPARGEILLEGRPLATLASSEIARRVAVVPQEMPRGFAFTVEQLVLMGRYPHGRRRLFETDEDRTIAREAMAAVGVLDLAREPLDDLSGGERQRCVLARALAQRPTLLVLDEPTAHLDLRYQAECAALLRRLNVEQGISILLVSHDLNLAAELSDRLLLLGRGRIAKLGRPDDVLDETRLAEIFACRISVEKSVVSGRPSVRVVWDHV